MSDVAKPVAKRYDSFAEFYPFYLSEHSDRTCRRLHFAGSALALLCLVALIVNLAAQSPRGLQGAHGYREHYSARLHLAQGANGSISRHASCEAIVNQDDRTATKVRQRAVVSEADQAALHLCLLLFHDPLNLLPRDAKHSYCLMVKHEHPAGCDRPYP